MEAYAAHRVAPPRSTEYYVCRSRRVRSARHDREELSTAPGYPVFCCMPSGREHGREGEGDVDCEYSRGGKAKGEYGEMYHDEVYCEECSQEIDGGGSRTKVRQKKKTKKRLGRRRS